MTLRFPPMTGAPCGPCDFSSESSITWVECFISVSLVRVPSTSCSFMSGRLPERQRAEAPDSAEVPEADRPPAGSRNAQGMVDFGPESDHVPRLERLQGCEIHVEVVELGGDRNRNRMHGEVRLGEGLRPGPVLPDRRRAPRDDEQPGLAGV